jgi:nitrate/nitrite transporter NarK
MFGWGNYESSIFVSLVNICRVCMLIIVLPGITRLVRGPVSSRTQQKQSGSDGLDVWVIRIAIIFDMMGYIGYSVSRTGPVFLVSGMVASLGGMGSPTVQSSLTKHVPPDRTGQLLGAIGLLHALARVVSPTIFNLIYASTVGKFSQTVFVCLASVFGVAFVISWFVRPHGEFPFHTHSVQGYDMLTEVRSIP